MEVTLSLSQATKLAEFLARSNALAYHVNDMLRYAEDEEVTFTVLPNELENFVLATKYM